MTKNKFDEEAIKERVKNLTSAMISAAPVDIDWREALGDDLEGWQAWEKVDCDECEQEVLTCGYGGEDEHCAHDCESECEGYVCPSGPMMNYYYPLLGGHSGDDALKIDGPLCLIEFGEERQGEWALALTGGGMDLSWDICRAYIALGYLPPVHFSSLPEFAGDEWTEDKAEVVYALRRANEIAVKHAEGRARSLDRIEAALKAEGQRKAG